MCGLGVAGGLPIVAELYACVWSLGGCWVRAGVVRMCVGGRVKVDVCMCFMVELL